MQQIALASRFARILVACFVCAVFRKIAAARAVVAQLNSSTAGICHPELPKGLSFEDAIKVPTISNNVGNVVWIRSAIKLLDPTSTQTQCLAWKDVAANTYGREGINAVVHPTANMIFDRADRNPYNIERHKGLRNAAIVVRDVFAKMKIPVLSIGVGVQADYGLLAEAFQMDPVQVEMFNVIAAMTTTIAVRGVYTASVLQRHGIVSALALGCPSLFRNHNTRLGDSMHKKLQMLKESANSGPDLRIGITFFTKKIGNNVANVAAMLKHFKNAAVILQADGDLTIMRALEKAYGSKLPSERIVYFYDPETWSNELSQRFDLILGNRIHGSMMALSAEVPFVVFPGDVRIAELVEAMKLPKAEHTIWYEDVVDLHKILQDTMFNATEFDCNRIAVATIYSKWFEHHGVEVHRGIQAIASSGLVEYTTTGGRVHVEWCDLF